MPAAGPRQPLLPDQELLATSYHEVGHFITANALLHTTGYLTVNADGSGLFEHEKPGVPDLDTPEVTLRVAAMVAAGALAEIRFRGHAAPTDGPDGDDGTIAALAQVHHQDDPERFARVARRLARFTLHLRWGDVERVATLLAQQGSLTPLQLAEVIGERRQRRRVVRSG